MNYHGLLLINKESGPSSHDIVAKARKILKTKSVGHAGTLDPLASGLMVLLVGEGTKISQYILEKDKGYIVEARFGMTTDTLDTTGAVISQMPINCSLDQIRDVALSLCGDIELEVPKFSAVKVQGQKLYEAARRGEEIQSPKKIMHFYDIECLELTPERARFSLKCSKGSFIRSWVSLLGEKLGCGATMSALTRTWSAPYSLNDAITLDELIQKDNAITGCNNYEIQLDKALSQYKSIRVKGHGLTLLKNGQISHDLRGQLITVFDPAKDQMIKIVSAQEGKLLALVGLEPDKGFVIKRVFNY